MSNYLIRSDTQFDTSYRAELKIAVSVVHGGGRLTPS